MARHTEVTCRRCVGLLAVIVASFQATCGRADEVDFLRDVQPILQRACYRCHGPEKHKSEYRLDVHEIALNGGELYAPNITPGYSDESTIVQFVSGEGDLVMPPDGP